MTDNHNSTRDNVLRAAGYCGRLKTYTRQYVTQDFYSRALVFHNMLKECAEFKNFLRENFQEYLPQMESAISQIEEKIITLRQTNNATKKGHCTVCNTELVTFNTLIKECPQMTVCNNCPRKIIAYLNDLECGTGVDLL
jgi:hypothetical protein